MNQRDIKYLGGLLHDIGKFMYRAQPTKAGDDHESLGEMFAREYLTTKFDCFKSSEVEIISHLKRGNTFILEADHASAGERQVQNSTQTRRALYSIFKYIDIGLEKIPNVVYYQKPTPLTHERTDKPVRLDIEDDKWKPNEEEMISLHRQSLLQFQEELKKIAEEGNTKHTKAMLSTLYSLLWKYTSTVSSASYKSNPDISLFDHSRMVAALSVCMSDSDDIKQPVILLKGDISGIQKFIYSEIKQTEAASKKLRGRSFFVKLLSDTLSSYIIREFNLYESNIVFNSGGGFEILIPANQNNRDRLVQIEKYINLSLYQMFGSKLQVVLAWAEYPLSSMFDNFNQIQNDLTEQLGRRKKQKSLSILDKIFPETVNEILEDNSVINFENIGTAIPHTDYIIEVVSDNINGMEDSSRIVDLTLFGQYWYLVGRSEYIEVSLNKIKKNNPKLLTIYSLKDTKIGEIAKHTKLIEDIPIALSFKYIATNAPFKDNYTLLEFSDLAKINSDNYPLLGVLRMDVDNLGYIFKKGLGGRSYSISRLASLSRQMDMFFTHDVDLLAKANNIYITYSGGDDLFAVGSWVNIINFAQKVRKEFAEYTTNNNNITLSGGIAITKESYPIAKSALLSGEYEDIAKSEKISNKIEEKHKKDKLCLFDTTVKWDEFEKKIEFANGLNNAIENNKQQSKGISNSFVYKLLINVKQTIGKDGNLNMDKVHRLTAKLHYLFARREMTEKKIDEEKETTIKRIKKQLLDFFLKSDPLIRERWYKTFPIIGNYVILKNRKIIH